MRPGAITIAAILLLGACRQDEAALPAPVEITAEAAGFYCQMQLVEHDGPKGQIHLEGMPAPLFFSQVRDAIAYLHMPEQSHAVTVTYVQDMTGATWEAPGPWIEVSGAYYVIGSDRMGGMEAPEFVPFASAGAAQAFAAEHGGTVRAFDAIRPEDVLTADGGPQEAADNSDLAERLRRLSGSAGKGE